ncbi:serine/threonine-protein kinase RIO3 [Tribolium castaneum]|uniref:Serine/threonine-protein kinase RIO3 n=1 Tax=Tribolium castaneum TaxID=7070 RepID=D6WVA9_TRICA|nr:PREDICTED: serine/threonine-protein kinase RIO3 [Tribolium castaneum]EFA07752.1 Serine/threonine-protein kinase RIO3-like Protein [Tribolium castaneum]|eukprot:XP_975162.1 PREDICTED: serine/threonine-protein kinase RIO3 [Tribolium castaneum]
MSCPWAKIANVEPVNLQDIMSEEVARELQAKEDKKYAEMFGPPSKQDNAISSEVLNSLEDDTCESDAAIARMLQMQFDKEYDENLKRTEEKYNGASKVSISFENYRRMPHNFDFESDSEEEEIVDIRDRRDWDRFDTLQRQFDSIPPCGYKMQNGSMVTKHDVTMNGRKNACKLLSFPPDFQTGDGENFDLKLSNKVFNSLKRHSQNEESRRHKVRDKKEDRATQEFGLDEFTRLLIYKIIQQEILDNVNGVVSIGKEAVILHADANANYTERPLPPECAIKVFKTTLSEFKQRDKYIKDDHRFKGRMGNQTARKTVHLWAEKEMHNLKRLKNANIPCPEVVVLKKHVLVMSFIGENNKPAPKLKDAIMDEADYIIAYDQVVEAMKTLFTEAELIHADLSEYNILWHQRQCYFIDVSQAVLPSHENAFYFLMRDCNNVINFFTKKKVPKVTSSEELFKSITGYNYNEKKDLLQLQETFKMKPHLVDKPGIEPIFDFDKGWEKSKQNLETVKLVEAPLA